MSFEIQRRVREFGVRMALGASSGDIVGSVLRQGFGWTAMGLALGLALSLAVTRVMAAVLYGVTPTDAVTFIAAFMLLSTTSVVACYLPARRAARLDPIHALRYE